jgi:hypothetical protein
MAELLILAFDTSNKDTERDVFAYKLGHVISVQPDGHKWGKEECLPKFYIVKLPKVAVSDVGKYLEPKIDILSTAEERPTIAIRKYKLDVANLPTLAKTALEKDGVLSISKVADLEEKMISG